MQAPFPAADHCCRPLPEWQSGWGADVNRCVLPPWLLLPLPPMQEAEPTRDQIEGMEYTLGALKESLRK